ncbi:MAG: hypothetical protein WAQ27_05630 [Candidatus Microsaccharimonas sp.]
MFTEYTRILPEVLNLISGGCSLEAEMAVSNLYHLQKHTAQEYESLLRLTLNHRAYRTAEDDVKSKLGEILYLLDARKNSPSNSVYVEVVVPSEEDPDSRFAFTIKENMTSLA